MDLRGELQAIYEQHQQLTPALVVEVATPEDHPLHSRLEWDDAAAGHEYRKVQAAEMIRSVRVVYAHSESGEPRSTRYFVAPRAADKPHEYMPTADALGDELTRKLVLREFQRAIVALQRQYGHLQEYDALLRDQLAQREAA